MRKATNLAIGAVTLPFGLVAARDRFNCRYLPAVAQPCERSRWSGLSGPSSMKSNSMSFASSKGSFPSRARAASTDVTFMRKTGPFPSWRDHHWSILPAKNSRTVSGTSLGKIAFLCSGVRGATSRPIGKIFVVGPPVAQPSARSLAFARKSFN